MAYTRDDGHSLAEEIQEVHSLMRNEYELSLQVDADKSRAERMEFYLRTFKRLGNAKQNVPPGGKQSISQVLDDQALQDISREVSAVFTKGGKNLFRWTHLAGLRSGKQKEFQVDDIFEAELAKLLEIAGQRALKEGVTVNGGLGAGIVGRVAGNISKEAMTEFTTHAQELVNADTVSEPKFTTIPTVKSAKTDVTGYRANINIEATIRPEWREFISLFQGARITVKNYKNKNAYSTIKLGSTIPQKAIISTLESIGFSGAEATHTFFHLVQDPANIQEQAEHIVHLRFAYELTGSGLELIDTDGTTSLENADFFIWNDPVSNNIWVRSTKEMVKNMLQYLEPVSDPLWSDIVILKESFT